MTDFAFQRAQTLADCLDASLTLAGAPTCRTYVAAGGPPAWDVCCDCGDGEGQAWVQVVRVFPTDNFPVQQTGPARCRPAEFAVELNVGVLRCAATVAEDGTPPSAEQLTADAVKVGKDRQAIFDAILCCFLDGAEPGTWTLGAWTPLGPAGGCVGSQVGLTVSVPSCRCPEPDVLAGFGLGGFGVQPFGS